MTDQQFQDWLNSPDAIRVVLIEAVAKVAGVEKTFYLSTKGGYTTKSGETPANEVYMPIASVGVLYTEELSLSVGGNATMAAGVINIDSPNGSRFDWLKYVWTNRTVTAWVGDPRWPRSDFRQIFSGVSAGISPNGRHSLNLHLRDKMQLLNNPMVETLVGGTGPNKDSVVPLAFGENHNITPVVEDPATLTYRYHSTDTELVIEVRSNGIPLSGVTSLAGGKFRLTSDPLGTVTASVQGDTDGLYRKTVSGLIQRIVLDFGKASTRLQPSDIDTTNFSNFGAANPQPVGAYFKDRTNVITAVQQLAASVGAQVVFSRDGKLRIIQLAIPASGTPTDVFPYHMVEGSFAPVGATDIVGSVKLGYCKNWTVQDNLQTALPEEHRSLYARQWLTTTKVNATVVADHKLDVDPPQQDTFLLRKVDADAEAQRRLDLWSTQRVIYEFDGLPPMLLLTLGQPIKVTHPLYGMSAGVTGTVVSLAPDWMKGRVKVRFIV